MLRQINNFLSNMARNKALRNEILFGDYDVNGGDRGGGGRGDDLDDERAADSSGSAWSASEAGDERLGVKEGAEEEKQRAGEWYCVAAHGTSRHTSMGQGTVAVKGSPGRLLCKPEPEEEQDHNDTGGDGTEWGKAGRVAVVLKGMQSARGGGDAHGNLDGREKGAEDLEWVGLVVPAVGEPDAGDHGSRCCGDGGRYPRGEVSRIEGWRGT